MNYNIASALTLVSAAFPVVASMIAGSAIRRNEVWPGTDMLVGFGLLGAALTILAAATAIPLSIIMMALAGLSMAALVMRPKIPGGRETAIALVLVAPVLIRALGVQAAWWDEFWHWLPSAGYEFHYDSLVKQGLAPSISHFPAYPQLMPLIIVATSLPRGHFLEAAGPIINIAMLAGASAMFADALASALARRGRSAPAGTPFFLVACAVIVILLFNPGLDGNIVLSSYADCGTMVAVGALGLIGVEMLVCLAAGDTENAQNLAWRFGFVGALLVEFKQANPVLLALVVAGLAIVVLRDRSIAKGRALVQLPLMLGPAIVVWVVWRWYVIENVPRGDVVLRPFDAWSFAALPSLVVAAWEQITKAPLFHAMMWSVTGAGVATFFGWPRKVREAAWLTVVCATVWLGYNAFLLVIYLGAFSIREAETASDYWRYAPHVALLALFPPAMALATGRWLARKSLYGATAGIAAALLALAILPLRRDLGNSPERAWSVFMRTAIAEMRQVIPVGSEVIIIQCWNESPFAVMTNYDLRQFGIPEREVRGAIIQDGSDPALVIGMARRGEANYLIVQDSERMMDGVADGLGLPRIDHEIALFAWRGGSWTKVMSRPIPTVLMNQ